MRGISTNSLVNYLQRDSDMIKNKAIYDEDTSKETIFWFFNAEDGLKSCLTALAISNAIIFFNCIYKAVFHNLFINMDVCKCLGAFYLLSTVVYAVATAALHQKSRESMNAGVKALWAHILLSYALYIGAAILIGVQLKAVHSNRLLDASEISRLISTILLAKVSLLAFKTYIAVKMDRVRYKNTLQNTFNESTSEVYLALDDEEKCTNLKAEWNTARPNQISYV